MNKLDLASWYAEHSGQVLLVFAAPVAAAWFLFFESAERQEPIWIIIGAVAAIYYWSKNYLKNYCFNTITSYSKKFSKKPELSQITSEDLIDTIDMEILTKIDGMSEDKGEYIKVIAAVDIIDPEELLERLGKLKSLGYVHSTSRKVSLTNMGIEAFHTTGIQQVALPVSGHSFDGPFSSLDSLDDKSGVYAIHDYRNGKYYLIDVGESHQLQTRVSDHPRSDCWKHESAGTLTYSALYVNEQQRMSIEQEIRNQYNPPCGDR